jgi:hypothetical protein
MTVEATHQLEAIKEHFRHRLLTEDFPVDAIESDMRFCEAVRQACLAVDAPFSSQCSMASILSLVQRHQVLVEARLAGAQPGDAS